jgi:uncharacterized protein with NRDE domain
LAVLTNFRTMKNFEKGDFKSRGILVLEYVKIRDESVSNKTFATIEQYESEVFKENYHGFNLIYGNILSGELKFRQKAMEGISEPQCIPKDTLHGISNADLNCWDKVQRGKSLMSKVLKTSENCELPDLADQILSTVL